MFDFLHPLAAWRLMDLFHYSMNSQANLKETHLDNTIHWITFSPVLSYLSVLEPAYLCCLSHLVLRFLIKVLGFVKFCLLCSIVRLVGWLIDCGEEFFYGDTRKQKKTITIKWWNQSKMKVLKKDFFILSYVVSYMFLVHYTKAVRCKRFRTGGEGIDTLRPPIPSPYEFYDGG